MNRAHESALAVLADENVHFSERAALSTTSKMSKEGVLKGVHLIGLIGKSNRKPGKKPYTYKEAAIKEAVTAKSYDNVPVYLGHPEVDENGNDKPRNPKDKIGFVMAESVTHKDGAGAIGDIQFNTGHPYYEAMQFWADKDPSAVMMSHVADLRYSHESNQIIQIGKVYSVDIVINGNTTEGMFKEGVIADLMAAETEANKLRRTVEIATSLMNQILYPPYSYSSNVQNKVLTDAEKAVQCATIAKDLVKELATLGSTKKEEATDMEYKDIKLADLRANCPELVKQIESAAISAESALSDKVTEAVKDIPADKRSATFLKSVREAVAKNDAATVKELVDDRKSLLSVETPVSTVVAAKTKESVKENAKTVEVKKDEVIASCFGE